MFTKSTIVALFLGQISARTISHHVQKKDIGEKGLDEEVHGFASADTNVLPKPWRRREVPYPNNGILNGWTKGQVVAQTHHMHHHGKKIADIGEKKLDEEVHGFASADTNVLPQPWRRREVPYPNNGILNGWTKGQVVAQTHHKHHHTHGVRDIGEKGLDEEVHGFASADTNVLPQPWRRREVPYPNNGILNGWTKGQVVAQ